MNIPWTGRQMKKIGRILAVLAAAGALALGLLLYWFDSSTKMNKEKVFATFLADSLPANTHLLWGRGMWWQGYEAYLVLETEREALRKLVATMTPANAQKCKRDYFARFPSDQQPQKEFLCYEKAIAIRSGGTAVLILDAEKQNRALYHAFGG